MSHIGITLLWLVHWLPLSWQAALGNALGSLLFRFAGRRRRIGEINCSCASRTGSGCVAMKYCTHHFRCAARAALEHGILWWSPM